MCYSCKKVEEQKLESVHSLNEEVEIDVGNVPEHVDYVLLNHDLKKGILGFRYENKKSMFIVYTSPEAKTFCILMRIKPLCNYCHLSC